MALDQNQLFILIGIGVVILALVIWMFLRANRTARVIDDESAVQDVLDEGAAPASRNQALIDAPGAGEAPQVPPVAEPEPEPVEVPAPSPAPAAQADDLRRIKGLGPKLVTLLAEQGITRFDQIAALSDADIERVDATLGRFAGRITRDQWVEQAKLLCAGDESGFSDRFGQNG